MGRREELEAKLIDNPNDAEARMVYADFLQSSGDPRGELIALQKQGKTDEADEFLESHSDALLGEVLGRFTSTFDGSDDTAFVWKLGFITSARFGYDSNTEVEAEDADDIALGLGIGTLLEHPSAMLLEELVVTINMLDDGSYFDSIVKAIAKTGSPCLRKLRLGEFNCAGGPGGPPTSDYDYEMSWTSLGDASGMWSKLPRLEELVLQVGLGGSAAGGDADQIGTFDLPKLRHLEVITGGLGAECVKSFANAKLPEATYMDLWFGSDNYGAGGTVEDLAPLFDGTQLPRLKHLGLMNSEQSDAFATAMATAKILPQLEELSFRYGTLTDEGARAFAATKTAFHLKTLDVRANCLTDAGIEALRGVCKTVLADEQKGDDERYVSLSE